jgi:hypothetical protein
MADNLSTMATGMRASNNSLQISTAVLKNLMSSQKAQGDALVAMINQTPTASLNGTGSIVNVQA